MSIKKWLPFIIACLSAMLGACLQSEEGVPPLTAKNLTAAYDSTNGVVTLSWKKPNVPDLAGYVVFREEGDGSSLSPTILDTVLSGTSFVDTLYPDISALEGRTVTYRLKSIDTDANISPGFSKPVTVQVLSPWGWRALHGDTAFFPTPFNIRGVFFLTNDTGYGVDSSGALFKTRNGGRTWSSWSASAPPEHRGSSFRFDLKFLDDTTAFLSGNDYWSPRKTTDGGQSWKYFTVGGGNQALLSGGNLVVLGGGDTLYAAERSDRYLTKSVDGGQSWHPLSFLNIYGYVDFASCFSSPLCYVASYNPADGATSVYRSTDDGNTWKLLRSGGSGYSTIFCSSPSTCLRSTFVPGSNAQEGFVEQTSDSGSTWTKTAPYFLHAVQFTGAQTVHAIGGSNSYNGPHLLKSTNSGETWTVQTPLGIAATIFALHFPTSQIGYAVGQGFVLKTTDGGTTWHP